jgi:hypothetical protein
MLHTRWPPQQVTKERPSPHPHTTYLLPSVDVTPYPPTFSLDTTFYQLFYYYILSSYLFYFIYMFI